MQAGAGKECRGVRKSCRKQARGQGQKWGARGCQGVHGDVRVVAKKNVGGETKGSPIEGGREWLPMAWLPATVGASSIQ